MRDTIFAAVDDSAIIHPGTEYSADCALKLVPGVVWKFFTRALLHELFEANNQLFEVVGIQGGVFQIVVLVPLVFEQANHRFERLVIFVSAFLYTENDVAIHLNEPAVTIPRESLILGRLGKCKNAVVI